MRKMLKNKDFNQWATELFTIFFGAVDANKDGSMSKDEYTAVYKALFTDAKLGEISFNSIDSNKNGVASLDEYIYNGKDFLKSDDATSERSIYFWGRM